MMSRYRHLFILILLLLLNPSLVSAQARLLFDGDFESGTLQGWIPGGENGGFASVAAKGSCFSGNDTTAITFNGNQTSNYAALLRSNAAGSTDSIASLRSQSFTAGNGILFSALSETLDPSPGHRSVNLVVKIINSNGEVVSEQPYLTSIIQLVQGCPSEKRDAAFSSHYIDTHHLVGQQITIEFNQNTNHQGLGYFTLLDNVLYIPEGNFLLSTSQPIAVAGTGVTPSGTFFLDPRASVDPDDSPVDLSYSWFIDGEDSIREIDVPCVNLNEDFQLTAGNNTATLYVNDGFHYAADTIRFVIPENTNTSDSNNSSNTDSASTDNTGTTDNTSTDNTDTAGIDGSNTTSATNNGITLTDPLNQCDVDLSEVIVDNSDDNGTPTPTPTVPDGNSGPEIQVTEFGQAFTIGGSIVNIASIVSITDENNDDIVFATVSIQNPANGDVLILSPIDGLSITGSNSSSIVIAQGNSGTAPVSSFTNAIQAIQFQYIVAIGETANTSTRTIRYSADDGTTSGPTVSTSVSINP